MVLNQHSHYLVADKLINSAYSLCAKKTIILKK